MGAVENTVERKDVNLIFHRKAINFTNENL
jgi:hypothetical protein